MKPCEDFQRKITLAPIPKTLPKSSYTKNVTNILLSGTSTSIPRHRYLDICNSTSVSQHRSVALHRYLDIGISIAVRHIDITCFRISNLKQIPRYRYLDSCPAHRHRYLDIGTSTCVSRHRYLNIDPDLDLDTSTSIIRHGGLIVDV